MGARCTCCAAADPAERLSTADMVPVQTATKKKSKKNIGFTQDELLSAFEEFFAKEGGKIDLPEFAHALEIMKVKFTARTINDIFEHMDHDGTHHIDCAEFCEAFAGKDRKHGVKEMLHELHARKGTKPHQRQKGDKPGDVFIVHASGEVSADRAWWMQTVCEFADLHVAGTHLNWPHHDGIPDATHHEYPDQPGRTLEIQDCRVVILMVDKRSTDFEFAEKQMEPIVDIAKEQGIVTLCFYETDRSRNTMIQKWRSHLPLFFEQPCIGLSRHFVSDSEQLLLDTVFKALEEPAPFLTHIRPPGADVDDFRDMRDMEEDGVHFVLPEYLMAMKSSWRRRSLPPECFSAPGFKRPIYVSYAKEDPDSPGPSARQLDALRETLQATRLGSRHFFCDQFCLDDGNLLNGNEISQLLTLSRFIILEDVSPDAKDKRPYLNRGQNFLELLICMLTGNLAPRTATQFVDLDRWLGEETGVGRPFRKYFRMRREDISHEDLIDEMCAMIKTKEFASPEQKDNAIKLFKEAMDRHPLLQD